MKSLILIVGCVLTLPAVLGQNATESVQLPPSAGGAAPASSSAATIDLSQLPSANGPATANAVPAEKPKFNVGKAIGKAKKAPVTAGGTWKWTTYNGSGQPCENVLTLTVAKNGKISGTLTDRTGTRAIKDATLGDGVLTFELKVHARGEGELPQTYTVSLDPDNLQVSVDRPDLTPQGKAHGGKHHSDHAAKHDTSG